jgi:hypothetical protein
LRFAAGFFVFAGVALIGFGAAFVLVVGATVSVVAGASEGSVAP